MKTQQLLQTIIGLLIITFLNSCTQDIAIDENQEEVKGFKILPYNNTEKTNGFTKNYLVNTSTTTIDIENDKIDLEIPIPLADFQFVRVYNISSKNKAAILYLIQRGSTDKVVDMPINYVINDELSISDLDLDVSLLENGNGLRIFVMNNSKELDIDSAVFHCIENKVDIDSVEINIDECRDVTKAAAAADGPLILVNGDIVQ